MMRTWRCFYAGYAKISAHLDVLRAQGAAALNIPALSAWLRQAFSGLDYAALRAFADREADPAATRYSMGQNMGDLGYYAPSDVRPAHHHKHAARPPDARSGKQRLLYL